MTLKGLSQSESLIFPDRYKPPLWNMGCELWDPCTYPPTPIFHPTPHLSYPNSSIQVPLNDCLSPKDITHSCQGEKGSEGNPGTPPAFVPKHE